MNESESKCPKCGCEMDYYEDDGVEVWWGCSHCGYETERKPW